MSEKAFWRSLKTKFKKDGIMYQRFEDMLSEGIPDLCIFNKGATKWIELKYKVMPKRDSTLIKVGIRPAQRIWHRKAKKCNIDCYVLTKLDCGTVLIHDSELIDDLYFGMNKEDFFESALFVTDLKYISKWIREYV